MPMSSTRTFDRQLTRDLVATMPLRKQSIRTSSTCTQHHTARSDRGADDPHFTPHLTRFVGLGSYKLVPGTLRSTIAGRTQPLVSPPPPRSSSHLRGACERVPANTSKPRCCVRAHMPSPEISLPTRPR